MSKLLPHMSLRYLLLIATLIGLVPLGIIQFLQLREAKADARVSAEGVVMRLARNAVARHEESVQRTAGLLDVLAKMPEVRKAQAGCDDILRELKTSQLWIVSLMRVGKDGRGLCGTQDAGAFSVGDESYFRDAMRTGAFTLSNVIAAGNGKRDTVVAVLPLSGAADRADGALLLSLDTGWAYRVAAEMSGIPGSMMFMVDRDGHPIYTPGRTDVVSADPPAFFRELGEASNGASVLTPPSGEPSMFGIEAIPDIAATVAVGVPLTVIDTPIESRFFIYVLLIAAAGLASFAVTVLFVELAVTRGLRRLTRVASGLPAETPALPLTLPASVAEVTDLANSFNSMVIQLEGLAYHDRLTGLGNRRLLERFLANAANGSGPFAVLAIDLDAFKPVNDAYGHRAGDQVLVQIAERLRSAIPDADLVARTGGDEFIVVLHRGRAETRRIALALRHVVSMPCPVDDALVEVGCCIGVAFVEDGVAIPGPTEMLDRADEALYEAKRAGRSRIVVAGSQVDRLPRQRAPVRRAYAS